MFEVLETAKNVAEKSRHVRINHEALKKFSSGAGGEQHSHTHVGCRAPLQR